MMEALENSQQNQQPTLLDVDPEVEAFMNRIAYSLQKTTGQQRECLFIDIHQFVYDTLFPKRPTAPHPPRVPTGTEPHLASFQCPPSSICSISANRPWRSESIWSKLGPPAMSNEGGGEYSCTLHCTEL